MHEWWIFFVRKWSTYIRTNIRAQIENLLWQRRAKNYESADWQVSNNSVYFLWPSTDGDVYYFAVVDTYLNEGKPRKGEIRERSYTFKLWWGQCLYWNELHHLWSPEGCTIAGSSTYYEAHCRLVAWIDLSRPALGSCWSHSVSKDWGNGSISLFK